MPVPDIIQQQREARLQTERTARGIVTDGVCRFQIMQQPSETVDKCVQSVFEIWANAYVQARATAYGEDVCNRQVQAVRDELARIGYKV